MTLTGKRILLLFTTTGYQAGSFREAAEKLGVGIVAGSDRCHNLSDPWRDGAIPLRFQHPEASAEKIIAAAQSSPFDAILAIGDKPTLTAALASEALGLRGNPPQSVRICHDKYLFRERLRAAGATAPAYHRLSITTHHPRLPGGIGYPCVLKPLCLSASRGVIRADSDAQFAEAFRRIALLLEAPDIRILKDQAADWILVESFLPGPEVALEGIVDQGILTVLALFDKPDPLDGPYFEETIYVTPSRLPEAVQAEIVKTTEQAVHAVGLSHGPIHAELRLTPDGPRVLEVAARPIGGLCSRALRFDGGMSLEELIIHHALGHHALGHHALGRHAPGEPIAAIRREPCASGVMMVPVPAAGVLEEVKGLEAASSTPNVEEIRITAKLKQTLIPWPEGSSYLGFIFARGSSPETVETALRQAHRKLEFVITPALPVLR